MHTELQKEPLLIQVNELKQGKNIHFSTVETQLQSTSCFHKQAEITERTVKIYPSIKSFSCDSLIFDMIGKDLFHCYVYHADLHLVEKKRDAGDATHTEEKGLGKGGVKQSGNEPTVSDHLSLMICYHSKFQASSQSRYLISDPLMMNRKDRRIRQLKPHA